MVVELAHQNTQKTRRRLSHSRPPLQVMNLGSHRLQQHGIRGDALS